MARVHYWQYLADEEGRPTAGADITFYLQGTDTEADIYASANVGHTTTTTALGLQSDVNGYFEFWVGDEWELNGGYQQTQRFRIEWYKAGLSRGQIDNIDIYPPLYEVNTTLTGDAAEDARKNKLISNSLAKSWNDHVTSDIPTTNVHNIYPVERCNSSVTFNKVISNLWANQIYTTALSASSVTVDASAADAYFTTLNSWSASGSEYYEDVTHSLNNEYPIVQLVDASDFMEITGADIQSLNANQTRIVLANNTTTARVTIIG